MFHDAVSESTHVAGLARQAVRLPCRVSSGNDVINGTAVLATPNHLHILVPATTSVPEWLAARETLTATLTLRDPERTIDVICELDWIDLDSQDRDGTPAAGIELSVATPSDELRDFVEDERVTVLLVDDDTMNVELMTRMLSGKYRLLCAYSGDEALGLLSRNEVGVLVTDKKMPRMDGLELLQTVAERYPGSPMNRILVTAYATTEGLEDFINRGQIVSFLNKPFHARDLLSVVAASAKAYRHDVQNRRLQIELGRANRELEREVHYLQQRVDSLSDFEGIVGNSTSLRDSLQELQRVRRTEVTVHIHGETGTGKEMVARAIHFGGPRSEGPFVVLNCAGIPESLSESTLFGHTKGSFTGADRDHVGAFMQADGGTLVLDEVSELSPKIQASLLRALQEGEVMPVGAGKPSPIDVRVISCTHDTLRDEVDAGNFREDLFYRLVVIELDLPPLRERKGDIHALVEHFLALSCERHDNALAGVEPTAMEALERYRWPGNVRELANEVERWAVLGNTGEAVTLSLLSPRIRNPPTPQMDQSDAYTIERGLPFDEAVEKLSVSMVQDALDAENGVVARAARRLGIQRSRLVKMRRRMQGD